METNCVQTFLLLEEMRRRSFDAHQEPSTLCTLASMIVICALIGGAVYLARRYIDRITQ